MSAYHDEECGVPVHVDRVLFEFLTLEGAQAGLSWSTILRKREAYRKAFAGFDPRKVARFDAARIEKLMQDAGIVRNRLKIESTVANARGAGGAEGVRGARRVPLAVRRRAAHPQGAAPPARHPAYDARVRRHEQGVKKRGFRFVDSTICYLPMQARGLADDHLRGCFRASPG